MCIYHFKSKLANRLATAKTIGLVFWLLGFFLAPVFFSDVDLMFRFGILLWYATIWWILWLFWIMDKHPVIKKWKFPFWFRWIFMWVWMNFVLVLFTYNKLLLLMQWSSFSGWSPYWIVVEWAIIWIIIEFFATKAWWEGKKLLK